MPAWPVDVVGPLVEILELRAALDDLVHDRWMARRLPALLAAAGFGAVGPGGRAQRRAARPGGHSSASAELGAARLRGLSYVEAPTSAGYLLRLLERGADALRARWQVGADTCEALKAEAHRRCVRRRGRPQTVKGLWRFGGRPLGVAQTALRCGTCAP